MNNDQLNLKIVTPFEILFESSVTQFSIPLANGYATIMPNHVPIASSILPGIITILDKRDHAKEKFYTLSGVFEIMGNNCLILGDNIYRKKDLTTKMIKDQLQYLEAEKKELSNSNLARDAAGSEESESSEDSDYDSNPEMIIALKEDLLNKMLKTLERKVV